jgi:septum formation protein
MSGAEKTNIVLASKSPRRRELFSLITPGYICEESSVDERAEEACGAAELCLALARRKCREVSARYPLAAVVGCDTVVEINGEILGKPASANEALAMLSRLSGRRHTVRTGVFVCYNGVESSFVCSSAVEFFDMTQREIDEYIATGEPYDKAGGYGIQGAAAKFVKGVEGDYYNVVGLPVSRIYALLRELGAL